MIDRLHGLRHDAIIRRHDKDCDICRVCTAHTHRRERLMSRRVKESNFLSIDIDGIRTNMLCDTSRFLVCHVGLSDRIQERGLAVVYMPHNTDDRRSRHHILLILILLFQELLNDVNFYFLLADNIILNRNIFRCLIWNFLIDRHDLSL